MTTAAIGTQFHALLTATPLAAKRHARTFHDYRATIASALCNARAAGRSDVTNGLIQALVHWKTEESAMRYSHLDPRDYAGYIQLATRTDAGFAANKDAPEVDPFGTCAELDDIATRLNPHIAKRKASQDAPSASRAPKRTPAAASPAVATVRATPRKRAPRKAAPRAVAQPAPWPADASLAPLTRGNCVARKVLCPRSMWPSRTCHMQGGAGWEAVVRRVRKSGADLEVFLDFVREPQCLLADKPMWIRLAELQPLR